MRGRWPGAPQLRGLCFAALALCGGLACTDEKRPLAPAPLTLALLELAVEAHLEGAAPPAPPEAESLGRLAALVREARVRSRQQPRRHPVEVLNELVFVRRGFRREVRDLSLRSVLLPQVLARRRGSCLGLAGLYLALGQELGLPLHGVLVPSHFFVRYQGPRGGREIELLKRGREMPRSWYSARYAIPAGNPLYLRSLTAEETLAVFRFNLANEQRGGGNLRTALDLYRQVVAVLPDFAEAQANLGLTLQRMGRSAEAEQAYLRARIAHPDLPGLQHNLEALARQR